MSKINFLLKYRIAKLYGTQRCFAISCGKRDDWISRIVRGVELATPEERELIRAKLQIPAEEIDSYFQVGPESIRQS